MSLYFVRDGQFHGAQFSGDGLVSATTVIHSTSNIGKGFAPLSMERFFFLNAEEKVIDYSRGEVSILTEVPNALGMFSFRHRVYIFSNDTLTVIDPASKAVERMPLPFTVGDMNFADTALIALSVSGELHYFFLDGRTGRFPLEQKGRSILGRFRRRILVLLEDGNVVSIGDDGCVQPVNEPCSQKKFISLEDRVLVTENSTIQSPDGTVLVPGQVSFAQFVTSKPDDSCIICYCEYEDDDPGVILDCGHQFHAGCLQECTKRSESYLQTGDHITFSMAKCPAGCGMLVRHTTAPRSAVIAKRFSSIQEASDVELRFLPPSKTSEDLLFYSCATCEAPFFGGMRVCPRMAPEPKKDPNELVCLNCLPFKCDLHGKSFLVFQCRYCCNVATHRCFGNRFVCDRCDARWEKGEPEPIACQSDFCPYNGLHQAVGCFACLVEGGLLNTEKTQS